MAKKKVFGIGFHKTGTKSLGAALEILGYRTCGPRWAKQDDIADTALQRALAEVPLFDAFQDNPWPILFRELDQQFPDSKFILTVSPTDEWIARALRYFGTKQTPMRQWIYGAASPIGNEQVYIGRYETHNKDVQEHFRTRPDQLLVMPLITDPSWEPLCTFLDLKMPEGQTFPHKNRTRPAP